MKYLLSHVAVVDPTSRWHKQKNLYITVEPPYITYVGPNCPGDHYDCEIDCSGKLLMPGMYNGHTHAAMTLFRGYGEDLPLQEWLEKKIYPAEDLLTNEAVYTASMWAIAEMLRAGVVSFSDMYFFCDQTALAVAQSGIKANLSRSVVTFDSEADMTKDARFEDAKKLFKLWHNGGYGRIKIEMALHAEYSNVDKAFPYAAECAKEFGTGLQIHLSETESEHKACLERHGMTPAAFFAANGCFDVPVTAAHCVWVSDEDMALMAKYGVTAVHNPTSNLKLGSGVMPLKRMLDAGVNVTLGTDGAASNNTLDVLKEANLAALLQKGIDRDTFSVKADTILKLLTRNGAIMQGRHDCGTVQAGFRADLVLIDMEQIHTQPRYDPSYALLYSGRSSDVCMTMVDGTVLYDRGEFPTIDMEKLRYDMRNVCENYFKTKSKH